MSTRIPTASRNAAAGGVVALLDAGSGPGYIEVRVGAQPATANDAATGAVLATIPLGDPSFDTAGTAGPGISTAEAIAVSTGSGDGTAGWFRAYDSDDTPVIDGSVTVTGGGGDMQLNTIAISTGVDFAITAWTVTMPGA